MYSDSYGPPVVDPLVSSWLLLVYTTVVVVRVSPGQLLQDELAVVAEVVVVFVADLRPLDHEGKVGIGEDTMDPVRNGIDPMVSVVVVVVVAGCEEAVPDGAVCGVSGLLLNE